jgi:hypothetical protein
MVQPTVQYRAECREPVWSGPWRLTLNDAIADQERHKRDHPSYMVVVVHRTRDSD